MSVQLKEHQIKQGEGIEVVVIEAVHETGDMVRISRVYDGSGDVKCFRVYKGVQVEGFSRGSRRLEKLADHNTMVDAAWDFCEACQKVLRVK